MQTMKNPITTGSILYYLVPEIEINFLSSIYMTLKDSLRRTRKKRGGDDWVTIDDLGRDFNGDDFEVGQIIDIKLTATSDPIPNLIIIGIYDKKIVARHPGFEVYYSDIYSVKFPRKKPPKSAMKTGRKTGRKKTEKRRLDPKLPLGRAILGGRRKKRKTRRKPRRRRRTRRKNGNCPSSI